MGVVYKAYDAVTKRHVAIKTMWGDLEPGAIELFDREWTVLARISHPNIVDILDTGESKNNGSPYFVMPLLPGKTLEQIIKFENQRLTVDRVIEIMCQACRGLQAAHDQNLVHRDLKPSNIFVMDDDTAKIIDFGIAHLADSRSVTGIKGTLQYMAPEQADMSSQVTGRSDIFALAVVCYEALTGRKPFARRTEAETFEAIRSHIPPPASELNDSVNNLVSRTIHKAMAKQPWHRFATAKEFSETLQKALRNEPIERFDPSKIQPRIERVKKAYGEGDHQFAMEILTELESEGHIDPDMPVLRNQIEQAVRQRTIGKLLEEARTRMEGEEHPLALQKLGEVLAIDPANADALNMRSQIERQRSEKQIEGWFRLADEHREKRVYSQAKQALQEVLNIDSSNTRARSMLSEIEQTEQEASKFREEKQRLYQGALDSYKDGEISSALSKLERGLELSRRPNTKALTTELDAQYQSFYNRVRSERDAARNAYAEGRKSLEDKNIEHALEICNAYLEQHPTDPMFQALKLEADEMQRQEQSSAIAEFTRRADAEPDLDKKFGLIQDASERYPHEPHFKSSLKLVRDRRDLVNSIVARARHYEERGQFGESANQWDILRNIYPVYPGLDLEIENLGRKREEHVHAEAKAHWMDRIDGCFANGEYANARDVIQEALVEFPGDKELEGLESLADQGVRRSAEANVLLAQGRELCTARNFPDGLEALRKAERLDPRNADIRGTLLSSLVEHSRELIGKDWAAAEPLIQEASALNAEDPMVRSLQSLLESHKRQESINGILVEARGLQAADDVPGALKKVDEGLLAHPNEVRLVQLQNTLRAATSVARSEAAPPLIQPVDPPPPLTEQPQQKTAPENFGATSFQPAPPPLPLVDPVVVKPPPLPPAPPPPAAQKKKPIWMAAVGVGALLIVGALAYTFFFHKTAEPVTPPAASATSAALVPVTLTANEPGVIFKVDGVAASASLSLKPGEHSGEASLSGYASDFHSFNVIGGASAPVSVAFTLHPALPELRFSSAIVSGKMIFDDAPPVDLQEGSVTKSDVPMGEHHVRIMDGAREVFSFAFNASPKQIIKLTSPPKGSGSGVIISSLSGAALVYATPGLKAAASGQPLQAIPPDGLAMASSNPPRNISVSDGKGEPRELTADPSALPVLTVLLNGAAERIPITVTANVPDGTISINGRDLGRKLVNGSRQFSLRPGTFDILVSRDGYQPATPQHLMLKTGDKETHLDFQLTPVTSVASLNLTGAPPEAMVFLDDVRVGTINASGSFSKDVSPGAHTVEVRKAGMEEFKQAHDFKSSESLKLAVQMHSASAGVTLHVMPASAKITIKRGSDIYTPANGQTAALAPGSYTVTAAADKFETKSDTVQVEAGKSVLIDWALQPAAPPKVDPNAVPFTNPGSWSKQGGWLVHTGGGMTFFEGSGVHTIDILKHKNKLGFGTKRTIFVADFTSNGNYTQYGLDGHNLYKVVFTDGKPAPEQKIVFSQDSGDVMRMTV